MKNLYRIWLLCLGILITAPSCAQSSCAQLLKNIGKDKENGNIEFPIKINDKTILFYAADEFYGRELWRTDGTAQGTQIVKDIYPGLTSSLTSNKRVSQKPIVFNGIFIFTATDETGDNSIWRSDGTSVGTYKISGGIASTTDTYFTIYNNAVYFWSYDGNLWKTSGTKESTVQLQVTKRFRLRGSAPAGWPPMVVFKGELWFAGEDDIWKTDGTDKGTVSLGIGATDVTGLVAAGDKLFFVRDFTLYQTDGSLKGTTIVREKVVQEPGLLRSDRYKLQYINGLVYFYGSGATLWRSDGTLMGTFGITLIAPSQVFIYKNELYYTLTESNKTRFWKTNGTIEGSQPIIDIFPGQNTAVNFTNIQEQDGLLYFFTDLGIFADTNLRRERQGIWQTNGTQAETRLVCSLSDGKASIKNSSLWTEIKFYDEDVYPAFVKTSQQLFFIGRDTFDKYGEELYFTNLTNCPNITATITGTAAFCPGGSTILSATAAGGAGPFTYQWLQGTSSVGTGTASLTVNAAGTYTITATDANGCAGITQVTVNQRTLPTVSLPVTVTICSGQNAVLTATASGGTTPYTYQWKQGTSNIGSTAATLAVNAGGTYTITVTDASGCASMVATTTVTQRPSPTAIVTASAPGITTGGSVTLSANLGTDLTYQWTRNGQIISGAIQATYTAQQPGSYAVIVSQVGCSTASQALAVSLITALEEPQIGPDFTISASPNPSSGRVEVHIESQRGKTISVTLSVRDLTGRSLYQKSFRVNGQHTESLNLSEQPAGLYLLNAATNSQQTNLRLIRQ